MRVQNDGSFILGVGVSAFDRLGLDDLIPNYVIFSLNHDDWVSFFPELSKIVKFLDQVLPAAHLTKRNTESALRELDWMLLQNKLEFKRLLTYKPVKGQKAFEDRTHIKILNNSPELFSTIENKANFRRYINDNGIFPDYLILNLEKLKKIKFGYFKKRFEKFVIQDSKLSGGRGTFIISDQQQYDRALERLNKIGSEELVISKFMVGKLASVQACISKYGVFSLPLQQQIISQQDLINIDSPGADSFNGGQWTPDDFSLKENSQAKDLTELIGNKLKALGYVGIFGIDMMVTEAKIYLLEVNARLTGMTTMIALMQKSLGQVPLLKIHVLEHLKTEYELTSAEVSAMHNYSLTPRGESYGYLIVFNKKNKVCKVKQTLRPGFYHLRQAQLVFDSLHYSIDGLKSGVLLVDFPKKNSEVLPNRRIGRIIVKKKVLSEEGNLLPEMSRLVRIIRQSLCE